ncbi:MAG: hypothetical protein AAFQ65_02035 [Myxococcota bacterium]
MLMPGYVTGEGEPYRPEILFWVGPDGVILGSAVEKPGALLELASESLQRTIAQPMHGPPHAPTGSGFRHAPSPTCCVSVTQSSRSSAPRPRSSMSSLSA